ncbi:MAG: carboxy-S-adenosyl-L-methionine synthase CmoA [Desulfocapsaceae bacterium]|nr:carboxy-S-adenosyl-L-methionine synthase CmoA [Desulfocapsaceae bacterium]
MLPTTKDTLFAINQIQEDFVFSERVAQVFDDMLDRSIPFYQEVIKGTARLLDTFLRQNDTVVDLGCATGTTLLQLARLLPDKGLLFKGIDNSPAMLHKARLKAEMFSKQDQVSFVVQDITDLDQADTGAFLLNYTLQFIRPLRRKDFIHRLFDNLRPGGVLILSEKKISHDPLLNRKYIDIYHQFKLERGYSELEIAKKREALENILIPFSIEENRELLLGAGFTNVETFFQWFNFVSFIAIKPG